MLSVRAFAALLAAADVVVIHFWMGGRFGTGVTVALHLASVAASYLAVVIWRRRDWERLAGAAAVGVLLGPVGGIGLLVVELGDKLTTPASARKPTEADAEQGNDGLSAADRLTVQIEQGRRRLRAGERPTAFAAVFKNGSLADQQKAIAVISLAFRPEMLPALKLALASDIPAVRVQAAAVYAKLRGSFRDRAKALLEGDGLARDQASLERVAAEAQEVLASGFIDAETARRLKALAATSDLHRRGLNGTQGMTSAGRLRKRDGWISTPRLHRYSCGGVA